MNATFYLGTPNPTWLKRLTIPLCVSRRRLARYVTFPRARGPWVLDSGGYSELDAYGRWELPTPAYCDFVERCIHDVGRLVWAAPQDWLCEPRMVARTGLSVGEHQRRTVENFATLRFALGPIIIPVLQGYAPTDYDRCYDLYLRSGFDLRREPVVGLGSVCRRSRTHESIRLIRYIADIGLRLHAFGIKGTAYLATRGLLASADSQAWSLNARRNGIPSYSMPHALNWRERFTS